MRILMTTDTVGGVWTYALDLARSLAPHGVEVVLASMGGTPSPAQREQAAAVANVELHAGAYALEWMADPWDDVRRAGDWLLDLAARTTPDIVHLNGYAHGNLPFEGPVVMVAHSCVLSWWRAVKGCDAPMSEWSANRDAVTAGLAGADAVVAPTAAMLHALEAHYGSVPSTRVIHNGRDASLYRSSEKEPFILAAGRLWDEAKNITTLAHAAPRLSWPVYIAGDDRAPGGERLNFENVRSLGRLNAPTLATWFARASVYALPARYEPFGLSALEAALSGCALVLGDIPSLREVWQDAAIYVPPDDVDALQHAIAWLIADPVERRARAVRARCRAFAFSPSRMASEYLSLYRTLQRSRAMPHRAALSA